MSLYAETDFFVLPSLAEGIPMVLMEAMAMQIPCVAPRITGIPELIEEGVDGLLYTVADVEDLTNKIRALMEAARGRKMGEKSRLHVLRQYDMARNTERFATVLFEQLGNRHWRPR
jgi:colanic acid/amylovoran biosynthesis glycosyltransferase